MSALRSLVFGIMAQCHLREYPLPLPIPSADSEKGDRHLLPERPYGCFAQKVPVTFFLLGGFFL
jgi:hypothetical protein